MLHLVLSPSPHALLRAAAAPFLGLPPATPDAPWRTPDRWLVVRQGGLRDDLMRLARDEGVPGWFDPPLCTFRELPDTLAGPVPTMPAIAREPVLASLLRRHFRGVTRHPDAWVRHLDHLLGDLVGEDRAPDDFAAELASRPRDAWERRRDDALVACHRDWLAHLAAHRLHDGRDGLVRLARAIERDPQGVSKRLGADQHGRPRRALHLLGLFDLRGGWRPLLAALARTPLLDHVTVFAHHPLDLGDLPHEVAHLDGPAHPPKIGTVVAPDRAREAEAVALAVRHLVVERGVPPHEVHVTAREARPELDHVLDALQRLGVPVAARRRVALGDTAVVRALDALLGAAGEDWTRHALVEVADHPLLDTALDARILDEVGHRQRVQGLAQWSEALALLAARAEASERRTAAGEEDRRARPLPPSTRVRACEEAMHRFRARVAVLDEPRPLAAWVGWLLAELQDGALGIAGRLDPDAPLEQRAWALLGELVRQWELAVAAVADPDDAPLDAGAFLEHLRAVTATEVTLLTPHADGVVVAEALAVAYRPCRRRFIVGLQADRFPARPAPSPLLDRADNGWRDRERRLFEALCAGPADALVLAWPEGDDAGHETLRSVYVDDLVEQRGGAEFPAHVVPRAAPLLPGFPTLARDAVPALEPLAGGAGIAEPPLRDWLATTYGPDHEWSPTRLEGYAKCSWSWFAGHLLDLDPPAEPGDGLEPTVRGAILHDALDRFYRAARERTGGAAYLRAADLAWALPLVREQLAAAWTAAGEGGSWLGHDALRDVAREELGRLLDRFLAFEVEWNEKSFSTHATKARGLVRTAVAEGERWFAGITVDAAGEPIRLHGTIDRVEVGADDRLADGRRYVAAVDYKTSVGSTPGGGKSRAWDDGVVLQVPLYAEVLRQLYDGAEIARLEYRTLAKPDVVHCLGLVKVAREGKGKDAPMVATADAGAAARHRAALEAAARAVRGVRAGRFVPEPAPSAGCAPFCPARDICRIAGGPREAER